MAKEKYVKLSSKAFNFFDAASGLKLLPGDVVKLTASHKASKRVRMALKHGHIEYTDKVDSKKDTGSSEGKVKKQSGDWRENVEYETGKLKKLNKDKLVELAIFNESESSEEELYELNKTELIDEILELVSDEDDE